MEKRNGKIEASVVDVTGNMLTVGAGASDGVFVGDVFIVYRILSKITDPNTGEVLAKKTETLGEMTVSGVRPKVSEGTYVGKPALATKDFMAIQKVARQ